jgi:hypothetical protein
MNIRNYLLICLVPILAGCASDPVAEQNRATKLMNYKIQVYGPACEKLGYAKDSDPWRECIQREYEQTVMRQRPQWNYPSYNPYFGPPYYYRPCYPVKGGWRCQ